VLGDVLNKCKYVRFVARLIEEIDGEWVGAVGAIVLDDSAVGVLPLELFVKFSELKW
jgi:hypothetical protein